jgi:hypothetical protein
MQAIAEEMALVIAHLRVTVAIDFIGDPVRASEARMSVDCTPADGRDPSELIESAKAATTMGNSLRGGHSRTHWPCLNCNSPARRSLRLPNNQQEVRVGLILVILLILLLIGALPRWGYSSGWGYGPSGLLGLILIIVVILALLGRI